MQLRLVVELEVRPQEVEGLEVVLQEVEGPEVELQEAEGQGPEVVLAVELVYSCTRWNTETRLFQ